MADSIRTRIIARMVAVFGEMAGVGTKFGRVLEEDWIDRRAAAQNVLFISEGIETYAENLSSNKLDRNLEIELRASLNIPRGVAIGVGARAALADLERVAMANVNWNGLAIGTVLLSNLRTVEDSADRQIEISLVLRVTYRTRRDDPTTF